MMGGTPFVVQRATARAWIPLHCCSCFPPISLSDVICHYGGPWMPRFTRQSLVWLGNLVAAERCAGMMDESECRFAFLVDFKHLDSHMRKPLLTTTNRRPNSANLIMSDKCDPSVSFPTNAEDAADHELRSKFKVFRLLIIGRANAGKTTILQKICNSSELPKILNSRGQEVSYCHFKVDRLPNFFTLPR